MKISRKNKKLFGWSCLSIFISLIGDIIFLYGDLSHFYVMILSFSGLFKVIGWYLLMHCYFTEGDE
jgi:hypothetical protein